MHVEHAHAHLGRGGALGGGERLPAAVLDPRRHHDPVLHPAPVELGADLRQALLRPARSGRGIDEQAVGGRRGIGHACSVSLAGDEPGAVADPAGLDGRHPVPPESPGQHRVGRVERRPIAGAGGDDRVAAMAEDAGDLGEERRHVQQRHQVEVAVAVGERGGVGDLEGDPPFGIEPDLGLGAADHLLGDVDTAHRRVGELAGDEQGGDARPGPDVERSLGPPVDHRHGDRERCEVVRPRRTRPLVPGAGQAVEVRGHRPLQDRPEPGRAGDRRVQGPADQLDPGRGAGGAIVGIAALGWDRHGAMIATR